MMSNLSVFKKVIPALIVVIAISIHHLIGLGLVTLHAEWLYLILFITVLLIRDWMLFNFVTMLVLWIVLPKVLPQFIANFSTLNLAIMFLLSFCITRLIKPARPSLAWFRIGKIDRTSVLLVITTTIISAIALVIWAVSSDKLGAAVQIIQGIVHYPKIVVTLFIIPVFAMLNAFSEEFIYRGIVQEACMRAFKNFYFSIVLQSSAFAAIHFLYGFPNGITGYLMTLVYGIMLGYIRYRTGGILAPYITHVFADMVIGYYIYFEALKY